MSLQKTTYGFIPTSISNCGLWLDGGDVSSMSLSGSSVTQWNDKSGNGRNYTTLGNSPIYSSTDGGSVTFSYYQALQNSSTWSGNGAGVDIFIVTTPWTYGQYNDWRTLFRGSSAGHRVIILYNGTSFGYYANNGGGFFQYGSLTLDNTKTLIYIKTDSSFATSAAFNGNFTLSTAGSTQDSDSLPFYCLGAYQGGPSQPWGTINEIIFYSNLGTSQRQQVEGYLAQKWNLTASLPAGHSGLTTTLYRSDYTKQNVMRAIPYYTAFTPRSIAGCSHWFDAADASSVTLTTTTAFTVTFSNAGVPTSAYSGNGVANGTNYAYLVGNTAFYPYLTQANWTWTNLGGISYGQSPFAGVNPITAIPGSLGYSAFLQVNNSTPSTLVRTTTIPIGVSCTVSFWYSSRDNAAMPLSIGVKYGTITIVTITQPISASVWTNSTTTFITSVANQNLIFTVTQDGTNSYYSGDQTANIAYVQVTYSTVANVADKSGNGVVLSNATGFTYPNRSFNGVYPSFLCSSGGIGQANAAATLGYNSAFAQTTPFTVFFVSHQTQTAGGGYIMDSQSGSGRQYTYNETLSSPFGNAGVNITSSPSVVCQTWIAGTSVLYLNGSSSYSGSLGSFTTGGIIVGNRFSLNESWPGHICELIYYSGQLGTTQRQQVESYLAQKWGLTVSLAGGHSHFTQQAGAVTTVANTKFKVVGLPRYVFASTGLVITHQDGRTWKATANNPGYANYAIGLNSGTSMSFNIYAGSDVYNSAGGRVALFYNGDSNNAVRHAGYVMWTYTFGANNFDFAWKFVSSGSGYLIYNDYPSIGSAWQVTYDSSQDRVLIQAPGSATYGMVWNVTPKVTLAYVYSSY